MSEHEHEYALDVQGGFYYCESCDDDWSIQDLLKEHIKNQARIKALEGVVEAIKRDIGEHHDFIESDGTLNKCQCEVCKALTKLEEVRNDM